MMLIVALLSISFYLLAASLTLRQFLNTRQHAGKRILAIAWSAMCFHLLVLGVTIVQAAPVQNMSVLNVASLIALLINILLTIISQKQNSWILLPFAYAFTVVLLFSSLFIPDHYLTSLNNRPGLVIHIALALLSYAMMSIASLFALLQVYLNHQLKHRRKLNLQNVPPLLSIEKQLVRLLQIGGVLLTLSISSGFLFLDNMLAPSNIDKVGVSVVAWCLYATLLWGHYQRGWRGQRLVVLTLTGNVLLAVAYFGSRLLHQLLS
ncbi:cytochrome C assembly family protein [Tolumonas lignilytica]|uniref:cytochrome C assembly family protein n=1 Tax=Tolumonas lignilytica TaxID=1283284 RepID=UPI0006844E8D|nr:cytochrome c biogenesis protein CcsA [Tolumonas lignilytica]